MILKIDKGQVLWDQMLNVENLRFIFGFQIIVVFIEIGKSNLNDI